MGIGKFIKVKSEPGKSPIVRVPLTYKQWVEVPDELRKVVWSTFNGKVPLENLILTALRTARLKYIEAVCKLYPKETRHIAQKYREELDSICRGIVLWVLDLTEKVENDGAR